MPSQRGRAGMTLAEVMIALAITGITIAGTVKGYIYCNTANAKDALYMAANGVALQRLEETRAATWDTSSFPIVDQLTNTFFPDKTVPLDKSSAGDSVVMATVKTDIKDISINPPLRRVRVDCIWLFRGQEVVTNSIETCRVPN
jgi:prepilin-type N-terminal cleavage/methylation domain-containing protein